MNFLSIKKEKFWAYLLAFYCACYLITSLFLAWGFTTDDAYISWYYARQLVDGKGLGWHESLPIVEGYSNFLWMMIASLVIKLNLPLVITMKSVSTFSLGAGLVFLYRLARLFFSPLLAMLPVFLFSHYQGVVWWTVSGLESAFYCALSILLIWQCAVALGYATVSENKVYQGKTSTVAWVITNVVLFLLALTRFEGLIWVIPVALFMLCQMRQNGLWQDTGMVCLWGSITLCCFVVPYLIYFIWRFSYFGHWIPNSYTCKAFTPGQFAVVDLDYLRVIFPLIIASLPYFLSNKDCRHLLLWVPSVLYGVLLWQANSVIAYFLRLFLGPFALFSLLPVLGVYQFSLYFKQAKIITTLVIIFLTFVFIPGNSTTLLKASVQDYQERNQNRFTIAKMFNAQAQSGATILLDDCGIIPYNTRADLRFIDSQCLNNAQFNQKPYKHNIRLYADYIQYQLKPDWVIANYYPLESHSDFLIELLKKNNFLADYKLIATLSSRRTLPGDPKNSEKIVDYMYYIYKRRPSKLEKY